MDDKRNKFIKRICRAKTYLKHFFYLIYIARFYSHFYIMGFMKL